MINREIKAKVKTLSDEKQAIRDEVDKLVKKKKQVDSEIKEVKESIESFNKE